MKINVKQGKWKRYFSVPCALCDDYLKLASGNAIKVLIYLLANEADEATDKEIIDATGLSNSEVCEAISFWVMQGVIECDALPCITENVAENADAKQSTSEKSTNIISHSHYSSADIAKMLASDINLKQLFDEASTILGRILKHSDHEMLIILKEYLGFDYMSIIAILSHCSSLEKTSPKYIETVAHNLFDKGITEFGEIEKEFARLNEIYSFENKVKREFGLEAKLTTRQKEYIAKWKDAAISLELIAYACEKCIDATNKVQFPYIDKILSSWIDKNITTVEQAKNETNPNSTQRIEKTHSFDIDDFDKMTLGIKDNKN